MPHAAPVPGETLLLAIGLGSNLPAPGERGDLRVPALVRGLERLERLGHAVVATSSLVASAPEGVGPRHGEYLNACALVLTRSALPEALADCESVERAEGRTSKGDLAPRTLDLDLLCGWRLGADGSAEPLPPRRGARLTLPHARLGERAFVLGPLAEVAPDLPILLEPGGPAADARELLAALPPRARGVRPGPPSEWFPWRRDGALPVGGRPGGLVPCFGPSEPR